MLALYRSAVPNLHADWGAELPAARRVPGLVVIPTDDAFNDDMLSSRTAHTTGARIVRRPPRTAWRNSVTNMSAVRHACYRCATEEVLQDLGKPRRLFLGRVMAAVVDDHLGDVVG